MEIELHPLFWKDVEDQALFLEAGAGLGAEFLDKLNDAIGASRERPLHWSKIHGNIRHFRMRKFCSHIIHYEILTGNMAIRFYGLYHAKEKPEKWRERL